MRTECCECDRVAASFWGDYAYCRQHLQEAKLAEPSHQACDGCCRWKNNCILQRDGRLVCGECRDQGHQQHGVAP